MNRATALPLSDEELTALWQRKLAGESVRSLVVEVNRAHPEHYPLTEHSIRLRWNRLGYRARGPQTTPRITVPTLRKLWERRLAGEPTVKLAAEVGVSRRALRKRWRVALKVDTNKAWAGKGGIREKARRKNDRGAMLYDFIKAGKDWVTVCELLRIPYDGAACNRLRMVLVRYCRREKLEVPKVNHRPKRRSAA